MDWIYSGYLFCQETYPTGVGKPILKCRVLIGCSAKAISQLRSLEQEHTVIQSQRWRLEAWSHTISLPLVPHPWHHPFAPLSPVTWVFLLQSAGRIRGLLKFSRAQLPMNIKKDATGSYWNLWKVCEVLVRVLEEFVSFWKKKREMVNQEEEAFCRPWDGSKEPRRHASFSPPTFPIWKGIHSLVSFFYYCFQHHIY